MSTTGFKSFLRTLSRPFLAASLVAISALMALAPVNSDAARLGGGSSSGRQSTNVTSQKAPAQTTTTQKSTAPTQTNTATPPAKTGASKWLGPLAGIAAGLGIGMLLSHLGLGGAMGDLLTMALLAMVVFFAIRMLLRMFASGGAQRSANPTGELANAYPQASPSSAAGQPSVWRQTQDPATQAPTGLAGNQGFGASPAPAGVVPAAPPAPNWFIAADFDVPGFLHEAKNHFVAIQKVWDSGDISQLKNFLTDDLIHALQGQFDSRQGVNNTEVVLLNAELLGIEKVSDGHLASVRFSGMLREQPQTEAFRFEEVWNLFKPEQGGWLLAGIQQIPVDLAS
jgi:predicted lipid-binding transport protein (Tim44 family)